MKRIKETELWHESDLNVIIIIMIINFIYSAPKAALVFSGAPKQLLFYSDWITLRSDGNLESSLKLLEIKA